MKKRDTYYVEIILSKNISLSKKVEAATKEAALEKFLEDIRLSGINRSYLPKDLEAYSRVCRVETGNE